MYPRRNEPLPPKTPSYFLTREEQLLLQMAPGDGSLKRIELMGDESKSKKQDNNHTRIGVHRGGNGYGSAGAEAKGHRTHRRSAHHGNPREAFVALKTNMMETLERTVNK